MYQCSTGLFVMQCFIAWFDGWHKQQLNLWLIARNIIIVNYLSKLNHLSSCLYSLHNTDKTTFICILFISKMKKAVRETQTLRAGCSKAEPKIFAPPQTPFSGAQDGQHLISWRWSLPLPTNPAWWGSMHAISNYRCNRLTKTHTHKHTNKQTHRQDRLQYTSDVVLGQDRTETKKKSVLVLVLQVWSCVVIVKHGLVTLVVIMILKEWRTQKIFKYYL